MIPVRINQILILSVCSIFIGCGSSTNERGIVSTTSDSTAKGSAYNSYDGFTPKPAHSSQLPTPVPLASATSVPVDSSTAIIPAVGTPAGTVAAPVVAVKPKPPVNDDSADIKKGAALIASSDCLACHKVDTKVLGPSYKDVANKYPNNAGTVAQLVDKIKKGGSGVWGAIPMSPHPALSDDDAKAMVKYILSLK